jgi:hypothetical protein
MSDQTTRENGNHEQKPAQDTRWPNRRWQDVAAEFRLLYLRKWCEKMSRGVHGGQSGSESLNVARPRPIGGE